MHKILWVSSEVAPFAHVGGLGDVSAALPKALKALHMDVRIMLPRFDFLDIDETQIKIVPEINTVIKGKQVKGYLTKLPDTEIDVYLIEHPSFAGTSVYGEKEGDNPDLANRYIFFSYFASQLYRFIDWTPDLIHVNDWPTSAAAIFVQQERDQNSVQTKSILTIHNMAHHGIVSSKPLQDYDLDLDYFKAYVDDGEINLLRMGIIYADQVTTVSPTYAKEIKNNRWNNGLQQELQDHQNDIVGIVHGIDETIWNPVSDEYIVSTYSMNNLIGKQRCKEALQREMKLEIGHDIFLIGIVTRLVYQKGMDLIIESMEDIFKLGTIQIVVLGEGDRKIEAQFKNLERKYPENLSVNIDFDRKLAHKIYAGVDAFLIPSRFEPCGLTQLYSMNYGTVPIAHAVGGLADTVIEENGTQTGFIFEYFDTLNLVSTINRAFHHFNNTDQWIELQKEIMKQDLSWKEPAKKWKKLYAQLLD